MTASSMLRWLLGVDIIPSDATGLEFAWQRPLEPWIWLLVVTVGLSVAVFSYQGLAGSKRLRVWLGALRALTIVFLVALLAGPLLRLPILESKPDWVAVLVDRSRSLSIEDAPSAVGTRQSRESQALEILADQTWDEVSDGRVVVWIGFDGTTREVERREPGPADGWDTDLNLPIEAALSRLAGRPASGIVLISDGRATRPLDQSVFRQLQARAIPLFPIPLGASEPVVDLAVAEAAAPASAFVRDQLPFTAVIRSTGGSVRGPVRVELLNETTGKVVDQVELTEADFREGRCETVLTAAGERAGPNTWRIRVTGTGSDLVAMNNEATVTVDFVDRPLRALYIEGYPRWEYRYLKNLLVREELLESSVMLLSADRDFAQEGNAPLERLPRTREEFADFDLFVIGDVPSGSISDLQAEEIRYAVGDHGAGLLWIAGERSTPMSWRATPLDDLLPMRSNPERHDERVHMQPTPAASRAGVLRLGEEARSPWPAALSPDGTRGHLEWAQRIDMSTLKPSAEVLGLARGASGATWPLVISMRYGAGQVVYVGTDETWRWRHGVGESFQERFWIQLIRMLSRGSAPESGDAFRLSVEPRRPETGLSAIVRLDAREAVEAETVGDGPLEAQIEEMEGPRRGSRAVIPLIREGNGWIGNWTPSAAGRCRVRVDSARIGSRELIVDVTRRDMELGQPQADHTLLSDLAARTGGVMIQPNDLAKLKRVLPKRSSVSERAIVDPLWNSPAAILIVFALIFAELVGRRLLRLA
ncbi:MAG: VWA domain-containing protein [Planctomycetes bacterium]|nr:VWA domain-containing protein [Planctomycetota bacterium]